MIFMISLMLFGMLEVRGLELPDDCNQDQFYDSGSLACVSCPANSSMIRSLDGFGCNCEDHSIRSSEDRCKPCNVTHVVSADGTACVPRRCQTTSGRLVCRKCPNDYISVTQNFDGSPMKEVLCVKCARGYRVLDNTCVKCEACTCSKNQVSVRGTCVPKAYVNMRPKYEEKLLHPLELLDAVKHEYLCSQNNLHACRTLANECVKNFYSTDHGGPCRLWAQPKISIPKGLPHLTITSPIDKPPWEIIVPHHGKNSILLALAVYTPNGGMKFLQNTDQRINQCQLPINIKVGEAYSNDCPMNITELKLTEFNETLAPFLFVNGEYRPFSVLIRKPNGYYVQRGTWISSKYRRYFIVHNSISTTSNVTNTIYLRTLLIRLRLERVKHVNGSLRITITLEAQYAIKPTEEDIVITTLTLEHDMPNAGVIRGLEIWGGVLGAFLTVFALAQWRGTLRRGGLHYTVVPLLAGSIADTLYFAALLSTLHALAAEAGSLGMTLPLSHPEERMIQVFIYSAVSLKGLKILWINWKQCTCDIFFLNWAEYNPSVEDKITSENESWKRNILAKEWSSIQTVRRASPGYTVTLALLFLHLMSSWSSLLPQNDGYKWAAVSIAWWSAYGLVLLTTYMKEKFVYSQMTTLPSICTGVGYSLIVFQEEYYAHYVHGRNDDCKEIRSMAGPLTACRVAFVPQLRAVYQQLSAPAPGILGELESRRPLLSRFLAAFFERALDGLNWVASERTIIERLLDVELTSREGGATSALLYDDDSTPSCLSMTWWGEEWNLSTFDAMLFSCIFIASKDSLLAALVTVILWQIMKQIRTWIGEKNQIEKTGVDTYFG